MKTIVNVSLTGGIGRDGGLLVSLPEDMRFFKETTLAGIVVMGRKTLESFPGGKPLKGRINIVLTKDSSRISIDAVSAADIYLDMTLSGGGISGQDKGTIIEASKSQERKNGSKNNADAFFIDENWQDSVKPISSIYKENIRLKSLDAKVKEMKTALIAVSSKEQTVSLAGNIAEDALDNTYIIGGANIYEQFLEECDTCLITKNNAEFEADSFFPEVSERTGWKLIKKSPQKDHEGISYCFETYRKV